MPFLIDNFQGDVQISVNDGTVNTVDTPLTLIGKGAEVYGEKINENFYHLMENFASSGPVEGPANSKLGQLWFHIDAGGLGIHALKVLLDDTGTIAAADWLTIGTGSFNLPTLPGDPGDFLQTDGAGTLSFEPVITELLDDLSPVLAADLDANTHKIINLGTPTLPDDATPKIYVDTEIAAIDLVALGGAVFVAKAGEIANDGAGTMNGLLFNDNGLDVATQLTAAGRAPNDINYLPTRGMIEGAFLQGFPSGVSQKFDEQTLFDASQSEAQLLDGSVVSWNVQNAQVAHLDLAAGSPGVIDTAINIQDGGTYTLIITQDGAGGRVMTFAGSYKWPGGSAPVLTPAANAVDIFTFVSDGTFMYGVAQQNFS